MSSVYVACIDHTEFRQYTVEVSAFVSTANVRNAPKAKVSLLPIFLAIIENLARYLRAAISWSLQMK